MTERDYDGVRMGVYRPLFDFLCSRGDEDSVILSFAEIERIIGRRLPPAARSEERVWWTVNPTALQARSWLAAHRHPLLVGGSVVRFDRAPRLAWHTPEWHRHHAELRVIHARHSLERPDEYEISAGWWEPHVVYIIHYEGARLFKVGLTNARSERLRLLSRKHGEVVDVKELANRGSATLLEGRCLLLADSARAEPPLWLAQSTGVTEFWRDELMLPPLGEIFEHECATEPVPNSTITIPRSRAMRP